jgi:hypothetical protein
MTIRAPYQTLHGPNYRVYSFEREVLYETLGACWALSARNISAQFAIQLHIDLSRVQLLYGTPTTQLPEHLLFDFIRVFQSRPKQGNQNKTATLQHNALALIESMNEADLLNFTTGFHDTVHQILERQPCWGSECAQANIALKYYSMSLIETRLRNHAVKRTYANLLCTYLTTTQNVFLREQKTSPQHG